MQVMSLDPLLERVLNQAVAGLGDGAAIEPGLADTLMRETAAAAQRQEELGLPPVLLVPSSLRTLLSRLPAPQRPATSRFLPTAKCLTPNHQGHLGHRR